MMYLYSTKELNTLNRNELLEYIQKLHEECEKLESMYNDMEDAYNSLYEDYIELNQMIG